MTGDFSREKAIIRREMRARRSSLGDGERGLFACKLAENVLSWSVYERAENVLLYYPSMGEIDVLRLAESSGKRFFLPITKPECAMSFGELGGEMIAGRYGIWEPAKDCGADVQIDLVIAPALACDRKLSRLGQGKGYYDRFLKKLREENPAAVAAAAVYEFQIVDRLPVNAHDERMDFVLSPGGILGNI